MGDIYDDYNARKRDERRRERRQQITGFQVVFVSILAIGLLLTINFSARIRRSQLLGDVKGEVQATVAALQEQNVQLRRTVEFAQSDAAVAQWAHREGKMVREGEVLVIPIPGAQLSTPVPSRTPVFIESSQRNEPEIPTWKLWWSLFFDGEAP